MQTARCTTNMQIPKTRTCKMYGVFFTFITVLVYWYIAKRFLSLSSRTLLQSGVQDVIILQPYADMLTESNALQFSKCTSMDGVSDATRSSIGLKYGKSVIHVGDRVTVMITTHDNAGNLKTVGGDLLKIFLCNDSKGSAIQGMVIDHGNGTYTGEVEAAWSGMSKLIVSLAYPREAISAMYRLRKEMLSLEYIYAGFQNGNISEETICHPNYKALKQGLNYSELCNFTYENSGMPWYCGKPRNIHLLCEDWFYSHNSHGLQTPLTYVERELLNRGPVNFTQTIYVLVESDYAGANILSLPIKDCDQGHHRLSWSPSRPTGFVYNREWVSRLCRFTSSDAIIEKMKSKSIYLMGDSNARALYQLMEQHYNCTRITEQWTVTTWHKPVKCINTELNFSIQWFPHSQPFISGTNPDKKNHATYSVSRRIDNIDETEDAIIVIHLYNHHVIYHHSIFEQKMKLIKESVERLLNRNKHAIVAILGPFIYHSYEKYSDFYGYIYTNILFSVFQSLHDKVFFLDVMDLTDSVFNASMHPPEFVIATLVRQIFSYASISRDFQFKQGT